MSATQISMLLSGQLIGVVFNTYFYGIVCTQYMRYHTIKFRDPVWIKSIVLFLFILDTVQTGSSMYLAYNILVTHFTDPSFLFDLSVSASWPFTWTFLSNSINALLAESILIYRVYRLTKSRPLLAWFGPLASVVFLLALYCSIRGFFIVGKNDLKDEANLQNPLIAWRVLEVALDASLSGTLIFVLHRARTGFTRTESIISAIIGHAVKTGALCAVFSIVVGATAVPSVGLFGVFIGFVMSQGKVYTNTLLTTLLQRRDFIRDGSDAQRTTSIFNHAAGATTRHGEETTNNVELRITKDIHVATKTDGADHFAVKNVPSGSDVDDESWNARAKI